MLCAVKIVESGIRSSIGRGGAGEEVIEPRFEPEREDLEATRQCEPGCVNEAKVVRLVEGMASGGAECWRSLVVLNGRVVKADLTADS